MRNLPSAAAAEIVKGNIQPCLMLESRFTSGTSYWWTGGHDITFDGNTYLGAGQFMFMRQVEQTNALTPKGWEIGLNGVPNSMLSLVLNNVGYAQIVTCWLNFMNADGELVLTTADDEMVIFEGYMDKPKVEEGAQTSTITLRLENRLRDFRSPRPLFYTDLDQKKLHSGDKALEYVAKLQNDVITWGSGL